MLKLKRNLQFRGHVYFQAVRPQLILNALSWLQKNNPLYQNTITNLPNIDSQLTNYSHVKDQPYTDGSYACVNECSQEEKPDVNNEDVDDCEKEDPLNENRAAICETCLQSIIPDYPAICNEQQCTSTLSAGNKIYDIAPVEKKHPVSIMTHRYCEELAFPVLFPKGRFGYKAERKTKLTPVKYFNARLLKYTGRFAMNLEYLFFAQFIIEQKKVSDSINIALKKLHGQQLTASRFKSSEQCVKNLIYKDQAYLFL